MCVCVCVCVCPCVRAHVCLCAFVCFTVSTDSLPLLSFCLSCFLCLSVFLSNIALRQIAKLKMLTQNPPFLCYSFLWIRHPFFFFFLLGQTWYYGWEIKCCILLTWVRKCSVILDVLPSFHKMIFTQWLHLKCSLLWHLFLLASAVHHVRNTTRVHYVSP